MAEVLFDLLGIDGFSTGLITLFGILTEFFIGFDKSVIIILISLHLDECFDLHDLGFGTCLDDFLLLIIK